eukprot:CAMPEP_0173242758 /NCGR_PEP_ID=MMETSP1142-20121109/15128_1 /TAXON_ID=483371 /ORGANISM="non described non described, Strain CCMP2298" /LENGTH=459 /DNA_ID=CAMNT_0014174283 /DNA_START=73 /DNA_END=1453 /DNA_ORIENTATION=+
MTRLFFLLLATAFIIQCFAALAALTAQTPPRSEDARWGKQAVGFTKAMTKPMIRFSLPGMREHMAALQAKVADKGALRAAAVTYSTTGAIFMKGYDSADKSCKNAAILTIGLTANECQVYTNYAVIFRLTQDSCKGIYVEYYADQECTELLVEGPYEIPTAFTSCNEIPDTGTIIGSEKGFCTTSSDTPLPSDSAVLITYSPETDNSCSTDIKFFAYSTGACLVVGEYSFKFQCKGSVPQEAVYEKSNSCSGAPTLYNLETSCAVSDDDDDDDGDDYANPLFTAPPSASTVPFPDPLLYNEQYSCVLPSPTMMPTKNDVVAFTATQALSGVSVADYQAHRVLYNLTLSQTIASTMSGVTPEDIQNLDLAAPGAPARMRMLGLVSVTSGAVATTDTSPYDASADSKDTLGKGATAGIVIGAVVAALLLAALGWFACAKKTESLLEAQPVTDDTKAAAVEL